MLRALVCAGFGLALFASAGLLAEERAKVTAAKIEGVITAIDHAAKRPHFVVRDKADKDHLVYCGKRCQVHHGKGGTTAETGEDPCKQLHKGDRVTVEGVKEAGEVQCREVYVHARR